MAGPKLASVFPYAVNNLDARLAADYAYGGDEPITVRAVDTAQFQAAGLSASRPTKFTVSARAASDALGRLVDPTASTIFAAFLFDPAANQFYPLPANAGQSIMAGDEGTTPRSYSQGDYVRCELTAGMIGAAQDALHALESTGVAAAFTASYPLWAASGFDSSSPYAVGFGPHGEYLTVNDQDIFAPNGSIYFGHFFTHDPSSQPKLVRKDALGNVTELG